MYRRIVTATLLCLLAAGHRAAGQDKSLTDRLQEATGVSLFGYADYRYGARLQHDDYEDDDTLNEARLQLELSRDFDMARLLVRADFVYDELDEDRDDIDLERGDGFIDLREANVSLWPHDSVDMKLGRQILTWGTGDYLFINDLFPKDWQSFFSGRDQEYLKAPSDAALVSWFPGFADVYLVYTPRFDPDRYITGERISYYNPALGRRAGTDAVQDPLRPDDWWEDDEVAARLARTVGNYELNLYYYEGYWKSPAGQDPATGRPTFPALRVGGASARGTLGKGIANVELGYYHSKDDTDGDDPFVRNSEWRLLLGYRRQLQRNLTVGLQYYLEYMDDYDEYEAGLPPNSTTGRDEDRHVTTLSLTQLLLNQTLQLSLFAYYSPSDEDTYLRPHVNYKLTDDWQLAAGGNIFAGNHEHTFFNQFEHNSNAWVSARYSF